MFESFIPFFKEREKNIDKIFERLVNFAKEVLVNEIKQAKAVEADEKAVMTAYEVSADKRVIVLDQGHDWKYVLNRYPEPLYVIHPRSDGVWQVATVRDDPRTFKQRRDLPASWAGLTDEKLAKVTGVPDAIFCHRNLFLAVAKTKVGALKLAELALYN